MDIICPLTDRIFKEPVTASDGFVYEKDAIKKWFDKKKISPVLKIQLEDTTLIQNKMVENKVKSHLAQYPEKIIQQYEFEIQTYEQWVSSGETDLSVVSYDNIKTIFYNITTAQMIYILNTVIDINKELHFGNKLIHYVCEYSPVDVVEFTIDYYLTNRMTLHCKNQYDEVPLHLICQRCPISIVKKICDYYINNNFDIECKNHKGGTALCYACEYSTRDVVNYLISLNMNMLVNVHEDYQHYDIHYLLSGNKNIK